MATFGRIEAFDPTMESWSQYVERYVHFINANEITDDNKKKSIFLTVIGPTTYTLLRSLLSPNTTAETPYDDLIKCLSNHYSPAPSEIVERFKFNSRIRKPDETISVFVSELRKLSEFCNYGSSLDMMIRDRLVCGIQDTQIQRRLLSESNLTLTKAIELAVSMETAARDSVNLQASCSNLQPVNKIKCPKPKIRNSKIPQNFRECIRCGNSNHLPKNCPFLKAMCHSCGVIGHLAKKCLKSKKSDCSNREVGKQNPKKIHAMHNIPDSVDDLEQDIVNLSVQSNYNIFNTVSIAEKIAPKPVTVNIEVNKQIINMEVDTGACLSLITKDTYNTMKLPTLQPAKTGLATFTGQPIPVLGTITVEAKFNGNCQQLPLLVVDNKGPNLCGRNWIMSLQILEFQANLVKGEDIELNKLLTDYKQIFEDTLGHLKGVKVNLIKKPKMQPKFFKARTLPFAMREKVGGELSRLQKLGVLQPVRFSKWAAPIVPVLKADKSSVRICGDFKLTANTAIDTDQYPLPKAEDIFATLAGGQKFTKLDLRDAYNQLELDEESRELTVINTHKGLFQYIRLPFGISSAPAIFQREMEVLMQGIPGVAVSLDDCIITGSNHDEHMSRLREVLKRFHDAGLRLRKQKCEFFCDKLSFLGHVIDADGIHPTDEKLKAIKAAPVPKNLTELRSFLGLLTYYAKFLPRMSTTLAPLYNLLQKNTPWKWSSEAESAFQTAKSSLCSSSLLVHFDPKKELLLACDASPYGVGAVLSHIVHSEERPIAFASRTLTSAEKNYPHIQKEALALIFGVTRFREYLLGRKFTLLTDHRPLVTIFSEKKHIPAMANSRIQRWALTLSAFDYTVRYRKGEENANADACSRLPVLKPQINPPLPEELVLQMERLDVGPVTADDIHKATKNDPVLSEVIKFTLEGWPEVLKQEKLHNVTATEILPYFKKRTELTVEQGILLWGNRVVIPTLLRSIILQELHSTHQGMVGMKSIARSLFWWPNLDSEIEDTVRYCNICVQNMDMPPKCLQAWPVSKIPWSRIHMDYAGPVDNHMILVIQDSYSKWIEAFPMKKSTSQSTIEKLYEVFARFGLPSCIVSDNGSVFTSAEFQSFVQRNGIRHLFTAPYHPSSNGQAERAVQYIKKQLKKVRDGTISVRLARILMNYRRTPLALSGVSPAELLFGRQIRNRLDLLHSSSPTEVIAKPSFKIGDSVYARNFGKDDKWIPGVIISPIGNCMFRILFSDGTSVHRHQDQLRQRKENPSLHPDGKDLQLDSLKKSSSIPSPLIPMSSPPTYIPRSPPTSQNPELPSTTQGPKSPHTSPSSCQETLTSSPDVIVDGPSRPLDIASNGQLLTPRHVTLRRSTRIKKPPKRLNL